MGLAYSSTNTPKQHINELPEKILKRIFTFLPHLKDRKTLSLVCRQWDDLAFDRSYLNHVWFTLTFDMDSIDKLQKISRHYRAVYLRCALGLSLDEDQIKKILRCFKKPSSSLENLICTNSELNSLVLRLFSVCPCIRTVQLGRFNDIPDDKLPILEKLEDLAVTDMSSTHIIRLAPNLRRLSAVLDSNVIIEKLPLEHLHVIVSKKSCNLFKNCAEMAKLTSVDLTSIRIEQESLEKLSKVCSSLTKLWITVSGITSLQCLANLVHLKVLSLDYCRNLNLFKYRNVCLPNIQIIAFTNSQCLLFVDVMKRAFPNVHYLKYDCHTLRYGLKLEKLSRSFPKLKTLELSYYKYYNLPDLLEGLSDLRELIMRESKLTSNHIPPLNLQQLTLKECVFEATDEMAIQLPKLQFLNLFGNSRDTNTEKVPPGCVVRRYIRDNCTTLLDNK